MEDPSGAPDRYPWAGPLLFAAVLVALTAFFVWLL